MVSWYYRDIASHFQFAIDDTQDKSLGEYDHYNEKVRSWMGGVTGGAEDAAAPRPDDVCVGVEDADNAETISAAEMDEYRKVILKSDAYDWLISKLHCDLAFCIPGEVDAREQISDPIYNHPALRRVSRKSPQPLFKAVYTVEWKPIDFLQDQDYKRHPTEALWDALTLTGTMNEAEGLACGDYICRTWPHSGAKFLELVESILEPDLYPEREGRLHIL